MPSMLEGLVAAVMLISLVLYALLGGADFGGGMWDLLAVGKRAEAQRHAIADAVAPETTPRLLALALGAGVVILVPSLMYLFRIFKGQPRR